MISRRVDESGFSFIELLAYMAIAALLILAAVPQFNNYRGAARDAATLNDVKNVAIAYEAWSIDHPGQAFPHAQRGWGDLAAGTGVFEGMGVVLSDGTKIWAMDRLDRNSPTPSAAYTARGQAFCIFAYNADGQKFNSRFFPNYVRYHSGDGGIGAHCDTK